MGLAGIIFPLWSVYARPSTEADYPLKEVFVHQAKGSAEAVVKLLSDGKGKPVLYTAHLMTAVCSDGVCKPIDIHLYWDLLGRFYRYSTGKEPLTKFDHDPFTEEDHKKLNEILADKNSILRDYEVEDMIDGTVEVSSAQVDGVTGATGKAFKDASVEGAMYTVYMLWHFVNGDIRTKIYRHTQSMLSEPMIASMLGAGREDYLNFVFDNLTEPQREKFAPQIIALLASKDIYTPHFALQQLTDELLMDPAHQEAVLCYFGSVSFFVQNSLLTRLETLPIHRTGVKLLLESVPDLTTDQLDRVFLLIEKNKGSIDADSLTELKAMRVHGNNPLSRYAECLLAQIPEGESF